MLAGKIDAIAIASEVVPILYLPGVSRASLRATDECPSELQPLAELQYGGVFWFQYNGKDWTISAFLQSEKGGLNLRLARDNATQEAIRRSLEKLAEVPVADLQSKSATRPLDGHDFDDLIVDDPIDDLLTWLSDAKGVRSRWEADPGRWEALLSRCKGTYGFNPETDGALAGAEMLGLSVKPAWKPVWKRFAAAPTRYAGLVDLLRKAKPKTKGETCWGASWSSPGRRTTTPRRRACGNRSTTSRNSPSRPPETGYENWTESTSRVGTGSGRSSGRHHWRTRCVT